MKRSLLLSVLPVLAVGSLAFASTASPTHSPGPPGSEGRVLADAILISLDRASGACEGSVLLLVDEHAPTGGPTGQVDRAFRLQMKGPGLEATAARLRNAEVVWSDSHVTALADGQGSVTLRLASGALNDPVPEDAVVAEGFGLARYDAPRLAVPRTELTPDALRDLKTELLALFGNCSDFECDAGGPGADQCGFFCGGQGCTVSCHEGFYPCCGCGTEGTPCQ